MKLDKKTIEDNTKYAKWEIRNVEERLERLHEDKDMKRRIELHECKRCFYLKSEGSFSALTYYECLHCHQNHRHPNSATPSYCPSCAKEHEVCCRCGASIIEV